MHFLEGLKKRSKYVIAMMDYQSPGEWVDGGEGTYGWAGQGGHLQVE